jgi:hypothetical protein
MTLRHYDTKMQKPKSVKAKNIKANNIKIHGTLKMLCR